MEKYISILVPAISVILGSLISAGIGWVRVSRSLNLSINEKRSRLKEQLNYLIELYEHNLNVFDDSVRT